jgi:hypothetical protein
LTEVQRRLLRAASTIDGVKFSVFRYTYPQLRPTVEHEGCSVASTCDLAAMKLAAVCQRTTKRDYVDVRALMGAGQVKLDPLKVPSVFCETETDVPIVFSESSRRAGGVAAEPPAR